ncbi:hypothetical protein [Luteibacter sp. E-22]|uniref:hypothetical protein n=1 Tax=Luteibacter sp. E-22 TaxID=3404050 RepID=UPI003CEB5729
MKYSRSIVSLALLASLGIGMAHAQSEGGSDSGGAPAFSEISKDGKSIKRSDVPKDNEALKQLRAHFPEADANHDGKVDKGEYDAYINKNSQPQQQR